MSDNSMLIVEALRKTDPDLYASIDAPNSWRASLKKRGARVRTYRKYEEGEHNAKMTEQMRRMLRITKTDAEFDDMNINYMRVVVDKMVSRLYVSGVFSEDDEAAQEWLSETLRRNSFEAKQISWWRGAVRDGDSFAMIDPVTLLWTDEPAYDGHSGLTVIYDNMTRKPIWACKLWSVADSVDAEEGGANSVIKVVVYQPERISYWKGEGSGGTLVSDGEDLDWSKIGALPVIDYVNDRDSYTSYGTSRLRPAISQQDVLNRISHSRVMGVELTAFKVLYSIGFELDPENYTPGAILSIVPKDENGNTTANLTEQMIDLLKAAEIGEFNESDTRAFIDHITNAVEQIAHSTNTPIYGITSSGNLSGEALKQLETGLLGEVERFQKQNTDALKNLIELTALIQNTLKTEVKGKAPALDSINVVWRDPSIRNDKEQMETLKIMREILPTLGDDVFIEEIGAVLGWSSNKVKEMKEEAANNQSILLDAFSGADGGVPVA